MGMGLLWLRWVGHLWLKLWVGQLWQSKLQFMFKKHLIGRYAQKGRDILLIKVPSYLHAEKLEIMLSFNNQYVAKVLHTIRISEIFFFGGYQFLHLSHNYVASLEQNLRWYEVLDYDQHEQGGLRKLIASQLLHGGESPVQIRKTSVTSANISQVEQKPLGQHPLCKCYNCGFVPRSQLSCIASGER